MKSISGKWIIICSFLAVFIFAGLLFLILTKHSGSLTDLKYIVNSNEYMTISNIQIKAMGVEKPVIRGKNIIKPKMANLQWQCEINNASEAPLQCAFEMVFYDIDGFVLQKVNYDDFSHSGNTDLEARQSKNIYGEFYIEYDRINKLHLCKITPNVIKKATEAERRQIFQDLEKQRQEKKKTK